MDLTSSWFLLLIVVLGGAVSLLADWLGRVLGKKRLRIGALRPKHTAMLFTTLTGMLVTLVTILLVSGLSAEVREWIVRGRSAVKDAQAAVSQLEEVKRDLGETLNRNNELSEQRRALDQQLKTLRNRYRDSKADLDTAQAKVSRAQAKAGALTRQLSSSTRNLSAVKTRLQSVQTRIDAVSRDLRTLMKDRNDLQRETERLQAQLDGAQKNLTTAGADLTKTQADLAAAKTAFDEANKKYDASLGEYKQQLQGALDELDGAKREIQIYTDNVNKLFAGSRDNPMIFGKGEEIVRREVPRLSDPLDAAGELRQAMAAARKIAENRGAVRDQTGSAAGFRAFQLNLTTITAEMQLAAIAQQVMEMQPREKLLVVGAVANAFEGEFVPLNVKVFDNPIVYRAGDVVAEGRINGNATEQQILNQLDEFVHGSVLPRAVSKGMIPAVGREDSLGQILPNDLVPLINQLREFGRQTRVQALAKFDTRAGGPLVLEFRLR